MILIRACHYKMAGACMQMVYASGTTLLIHLHEAMHSCVVDLSAKVVATSTCAVAIPLAQMFVLRDTNPPPSDQVTGCAQ